MPKLSSYSHRSSQDFENFGYGDEEIEDNNFAEKKTVENSFDENRQSPRSSKSNTLRNKAINKVKGILNQVLSSKNIPAPKKGKEQEKEEIQTEPFEDIAQKHLSGLIELALIHPDYLKTESVLRLFTNEVEKQLAIDNMQEFFTKAKTAMPKVNLLTVLIKHQLKYAISQEQKKSIFLGLGLAEDEFDNQNIADARFHEINQNLEARVSQFSEFPLALKDAIYFGKEIAKHQSVNKMPPSTIAASLAPSLLPQFKNTPEYLLGLLRFEMQTTSLLKFALKHWIETEISS